MLVEHVFGSTLQSSERWLAQLMKSLGTDDAQLACRVLRATLHLLRDRLIPEEAVQLGAQLPTLLRGLYYEGWVPDRTPRKLGLEEFLDEVNRRAQDSNPDADPEPAVRAVLATLADHVSPGEMADVRGMLPRDFGTLFED